MIKLGLLAGSRMLKDWPVKEKLISAYANIRQQTTHLCHPLVKEDYVIQSIEDVSPPKWHLAHTTWFFETFLLLPYLPNYRAFDLSFHYLFNSYYQQIGQPFPRAMRGLLARPTVERVYQYREYVDEHMFTLLENHKTLAELKAILILGMQHEQQHQELLLMDIKHNFFIDPTFPVYHTTAKQLEKPLHTRGMFAYVQGGTIEIGCNNTEFCFDNELPRHAYILKPYELATQLVTNEEYAEFIAAGGYQRAEWWLSDGWDLIHKHHWQAPLYWHRDGNTWQLFTMHGLQKLGPADPVAHVSFYEADAYARWRNCRLPTEAEWEHYAATQPIIGNFLENQHFHPLPASEHQQLFGDVWEWTASAYLPYPGYQPLNGALGEYNGKFMSNQMVLRGGSCVTPQSQIRASYRNFFQPDKRWQFSGIRLARNVQGE